MWDVYRADVAAYNAARAAADPNAPPLPEAPRPADAGMAAGLDAFEALERQLAAKKRAAAANGGGGGGG